MSHSRPTIHVFPQVDALAGTLRRQIIQRQDDSVAQRGMFRIAVSAGAVPETLAAAIAIDAGSTESGQLLEFRKWEIFLADERAVPLDHADSNFRLLKETVLDRIPADQQPKVHAIDTRHLHDLGRLTSDYEALLEASFGTQESFPVLDMLILGCGPDGHACSLFPGHPLLQVKHSWVAPIDDSPKPPPRRITLTLPVVTGGDNVTFVVLGREKTDMLRRTFGGNHQLTSTLINEAARERVVWLVDEEATNGIAFPPERVHVVREL